MGLLAGTPKTGVVVGIGGLRRGWSSVLERPSAVLAMSNLPTTP